MGIDVSYIGRYSTDIINVINDALVPILMALALIVFLWGVYKYFIVGGADEKAHTEGKWFVLYGIIGFVIIISVWGMVNIVSQTLNFDSAGTNSPTPPTFGS